MAQAKQKVVYLQSRWGTALPAPTYIQWHRVVSTNIHSLFQVGAWPFELAAL